MKHRLYWWFKGAAAGRTGGPWWCKDFSSRRKALQHLKDLGGLRTMSQARLAVVDEKEYPIEALSDLQPPEDAEVRILLCPPACAGRQM